MYPSQDMSPFLSFSTVYYLWRRKNKHTAKEDTHASSIVFIPPPLEIKSE
jgi:hypothetical protein